EVIAGDTVDRTSIAERLAARGEVIVSAEVVDLIDPQPPVIAWRQSGAVRFAVVGEPAETTPAPPPLPNPPLAPGVAKSWLLPPVFEHLAQGGDQFLAELRPSVPLFVRFGGIDYDRDDDAGAQLDEFVRRVQVILDRYEGFLIQITMGDKGSYLYISFGAPVAHENDVVRAAAAALEMRDLPGELDSLEPLQIGISR